MRLIDNETAIGMGHLKTSQVLPLPVEAHFEDYPAEVESEVNLAQMIE